ncbi:STAS domain-containing protein [Streptomyces sp. NPDC005244]|uniref:STAS domain-containing protein n=1 Tax=Streptomyces sp. NPDC005244 TaxID=3364708 RepID=UPI0036BC2A08
MTHADSPAGQPALTITAQDIDRRARVLSLTGDIDFTQIGPLEEALAAALRMNPPLRLLVIDLDGVGFCDSSGLNVFLQARQATEERGIELRLVHPALPVQRVLQITGTADIFLIYDDLAQALA